MLNRLILVPYKKGSRTVKAIRNHFKSINFPCRTIYPQEYGTRACKKRATDLIIYFGGRERVLAYQKQKQINQYRVGAINKYHTLQLLKIAEISTVNWTRDKEEVETWRKPKKPDECFAIARTILTGHSGEGCISLHGTEEIPDAPLYTQYKKKTYEGRVHVFCGEVIDYAVKKRRKDTEIPANNTIRNIYTGWVYCRKGETCSPVLQELAIDTMKALNLDFGAVDFIYNQHEDKYFILEVNTVPGIENTTLTNYIKAIKNVIDSN
jgi:hypothetical protein